MVTTLPPTCCLLSSSSSPCKHSHVKSMAVDSILSNVYTSVGCNRTPHALDWGHNDLVCFAASHAVSIYDPQFAKSHGKITQMLYEHKGRVNCVRWIQSPQPAVESEFLSGATDKCVILWSSNILASRLKDLDANINSVDGIYWEHQGSLKTVIVAVGDNQLCVWIRHNINSECQLVQKFCSGAVLFLDCKIQLLPGSGSPVIACAGDDGNIHLFLLQMISDELSCVKSLKITGHDDWVRTLAFTVEDNGDLLLASAAQDSLIRVWRITQNTVENNQSGTNSSTQLYSNQGNFSLTFKNQFQFKCQLETVLQGHENWVYGLHWQPPVLQNGCWMNPLRLLSCSMDKSMIIWGLDASSGVWLDQVRVGEVGGNTLGLYGCRFGPQGTSILAHGYQGALHLWQDIQGEWKPGVVCGGHFGSVEDMIWDTKGQFAITVSTDQTSRLHAPWIQNEEAETTWHEIGRPQVHGYDLSCIASLGRFSFASGAEEKVIRLFEAPRNFLENLTRVSRIDGVLPESAPEGAAVPALGLSNKPVYQVVERQKETKLASGSDLYAENYFTPSHLDVPPTEETLLQNTLWPELHKLYGHGYELFSLAADPAGKILVSSSRAQQAEHAAILVWSIEDKTLIGRLNAHTLTVSQMTFSPDGSKLVSVSRDRSWAVHEKENNSSSLMLKTVARGSGGSRILWSCDWSPDSHYFVTGSRDKRVIIWEPDQNRSYRISGQPLECEDSVTAVAFCPTLISTGVFLLAVGLDNGKIFLHSWDSSSFKWTFLTSLTQCQAHHMTIKRLKFRPVVSDHPRTVQLASCGADNTFKIFQLDLKM